MSVEAMSWALSTPLSGTAKIILIGLANHATAEMDHARPAVARLATYANCDRRTVQRHLRQLEADGWIAAMGAHPVDGRPDRAVTIYRLIPRGDTGAAPLENGATSEHERGDTAMPPEPSIEPSSSVEVARTREASDPFLHCFAYWQERTGHQRARPTADLRRKFQARLAEGFTVDDVRTGIDGIAVNGYVNERGVKHDDFELVVRNGEKLRLNIARASAGSLPENVRELPQNSTASERRQANEKRQMEILMRQAGMSR